MCFELEREYRDGRFFTFSTKRVRREKSGNAFEVNVYNMAKSIERIGAATNEMTKANIMPPFVDIYFKINKSCWFIG